MLISMHPHRKSDSQAVRQAGRQADCSAESLTMRKMLVNNLTGETINVEVERKDQIRFLKPKVMLKEAREVKYSGAGCSAFNYHTGKCDEPIVTQAICQCCHR